MAALRVVRKKIGELLIERGIITQKELFKVLEEQKKKGGYLSKHLITMGFATELDIATCLSNQYNFAYLPLKNYEIPEEVLNLIPLKWVKIYTLLPVDRVGNSLSVAMADPLNEGVIQMLSQICNCKIVVFVSTYSELNEAIKRYFGSKLNDLEKSILDPEDLEQVRLTVNQFVQTKAYKGNERRQYIRINKELDVAFYYRSKGFQGKTKDISYGGVSFISEDRGHEGVQFLSDVFIPLDTSLSCVINLQSGQSPINAVVKVLRVQAIQNKSAKDSKAQSGQKYEISGMFEFMSSDDREVLVLFLKENIIQKAK